MTRFASGLIAAFVCFVFPFVGYAEEPAAGSANCDPALCKAAGITEPTWLNVVPTSGRGIKICSCGFDTVLCTSGEGSTTQAGSDCVPTSTMFATTQGKFCFHVPGAGGRLEIRCVPPPP